MIAVNGTTCKRITQALRKGRRREGQRTQSSSKRKTHTAPPDYVIQGGSTSYKVEYAASLSRVESSECKNTRPDPKPIDVNGKTLINLLSFGSGLQCTKVYALYVRYKK